MKKIAIFTLLAVTLLVSSSCDGTGFGTDAELLIVNPTGEIDTLNDSFTISFGLRNDSQYDYDSLYIDFLITAGTSSEGKSISVYSFGSDDMFYQGNTILIEETYYSSDFSSIIVDDITLCRVQTIQAQNLSEGLDDNSDYEGNDGVIYQNY